MRRIYKGTVPISYAQLVVYDAGVRFPACDWTQEHSEQGFARREGTLCIGTLLPHGLAELAAYETGAVPEHDYVRVIETPFHAMTGDIRVEAPDEYPTARGFRVPVGQYALTFGQTVLDEEELKVDLYFANRPTAPERSRIVVQDEDLNPPAILLEHAETPRI